MRWQQLSLKIFLGFSLSCSFLILIIIHGMIQNVTLYGKPHPLTSALLSRGGILSRTTLLDGFNRISLLHLLTQILGLGPWPNIYIDMGSWAYHSLQLLFKLFILLFMGLIALFDTIHGFHRTVSVNFQFYLKYFQQKVLSFNQISCSQMDSKQKKVWL